MIHPEKILEFKFIDIGIDILDYILMSMEWIHKISLYKIGNIIHCLGGELSFFYKF